MKYVTVFLSVCWVIISSSVYGSNPTLNFSRPCSSSQECLSCENEVSPPTPEFSVYATWTPPRSTSLQIKEEAPAATSTGNSDSSKVNRPLRYFLKRICSHGKNHRTPVQSGRERITR